MSAYSKLLSCWHKLEHFSPAQVPKFSEKGVSLIEDDNLPWMSGSKPYDDKYTYEYIIYLGVFESRYVDEFISNFFSDKRIDENYSSSKICFATISLNIDGKYINDSFGISSLPWALGQLQNNQISSHDWSSKFDEVKEQLVDYIDLTFKKDLTNEDGEVIKESRVLNRQQLEKFQNKIEEICHWSVKPPKKIIVKRVDRYKTNKETSNAEILNSFYIQDLEKILTQFDAGTCSISLKQFLDGSLNKKSNRKNLTEDIDELKQVLTPQNYPDGCWPTEYTLSLMQQYAINTIFHKLSGTNKEGIYSVNGPPGTGKTTLLRDVIAAILVDRAKKMASIQDPSDAFQCTGKLEINPGFTPYIYRPNSKIAEGGIVIASSNNGAVENISKELPLKKEVARRYQDEISYFKDVAESCIDENYWGIISAVLGNKENRANLVNNLWFKKGQINLRRALKEGEKGNLEDWEKVCEKFQDDLRQVQEEKMRLSQFRANAIKLNKAKSKKWTLSQELDRLQSILQSKTLEFEALQDKIAMIKQNKSEVLQELNTIKGTKPNLIAYWFNATKRRLYKDALNIALSSYNQISFDLNSTQNLLDETSELVRTLQAKKKVVLEDLELIAQHISRCTEIEAEAKKELKNNYADDAYWKNIETKKTQESCPWYSSKLKELQSKLFISALELNENFIITANAKSNRIGTTLSAFFAYLKGGQKPSNEQVKAMWDTFFLVVPVISTTFASVQTMFKDLGENDIPYLFIDEAGQAVPQEAVGSIWRAKRVGVVGDPFQIEPVVTISKSITDNISNYFDLNENQINSSLSVQSMADRINSLGTYLTQNGNTEWIGIPLRVHRRCIDPMFSIANSIAYDNKMFCSTKPPNRVEVNFVTSFIDCKGQTQGRHFVEKQAEIVKKILISEIANLKGLPDVFVITPFSEISYKLKRFMTQDILREINKHHKMNTKEVNEWLASHIGTVHTFQGKQAEGVILCLGLDKNTAGAANWASQKPNLLNVALTRAKYRFIAIGDKDIWLNKPYFNQLSKLNNQPS